VMITAIGSGPVQKCELAGSKQPTAAR
jgi:hypothetical protein